MIKTIIVDDDIIACSNLKSIIENNFPKFEVIDTAHSVSEALKLIEKKHPQLVLLDISLPDGTGFDILKLTNHRNFEIIFTTSHNEFAIKAFEFAALHYLLKPLSIVSLGDALNRYLENQTFSNIKEKSEIIQQVYKNKPEKIIIQIHETNSNNKCVRIPVSIKDIVRCESDSNYTIFHLNNNKKYTISKQLGTIENLMSDYNFIRISNRHLINPLFIKKYSKGNSAEVELLDGNKLTITDTKSKSAFELLERVFKII